MSSLAREVPSRFNAHGRYSGRDYRGRVGNLIVDSNYIPPTAVTVNVSPYNLTVSDAPDVMVTVAPAVINLPALPIEGRKFFSIRDSGSGVSALNTITIQPPAGVSIDSLGAGVPLIFTVTDGGYTLTYRQGRWYTTSLTPAQAGIGGGGGGGLTINQGSVLTNLNTLPAPNLVDQYLYTSSPTVWTTGTIKLEGRNLLAQETKAAQRQSLGLTIGTDVQAASSNLTTMAGLWANISPLVNTTDGGIIFKTNDSLSGGSSIISKPYGRSLLTLNSQSDLVTATGAVTKTGSGTQNHVVRWNSANELKDSAVIIGTDDVMDLPQGARVKNGIIELGDTVSPLVDIIIRDAENAIPEPNIVINRHVRDAMGQLNKWKVQTTNYPAGLPPFPLKTMTNETWAFACNMQAVSTTSTPTFVNILTTGTPTNPNHVVNKNYVDTVIIAGGVPFDPVVVATSSVFNQAYTGTPFYQISGPVGTDLVIDGVKFSNNNFPNYVSNSIRVLIKNHSTAELNGIYTITQLVSNPGVSGQFILTRAADFTPAVQPITIGRNVFVAAPQYKVLNKVQYATTANLNGYVYNLAASTISNVTPGVALQLDGYTFTVNDEGKRILVKNQTNNYENGIYTLTSYGGGLTPWQLTQAIDFFGGVVPINANTRVSVEFGATLNNTNWNLRANVIVMGTSPVIWDQIETLLPFASSTTPGCTFSLTATVTTIDLNPVNFTQISCIPKPTAGLGINSALIPGGTVQVLPEAPLGFNGNNLGITSAVPVNKGGTGVTLLSGNKIVSITGGAFQFTHDTPLGAIVGTGDTNNLLGSAQTLFGKTITHDSNNVRARSLAITTVPAGGLVDISAATPPLVGQVLTCTAVSPSYTAAWSDVVVAPESYGVIKVQTGKSNIDGKQYSELRDALAWINGNNGQTPSWVVEVFPGTYNVSEPGLGPAFYNNLRFGTWIHANNTKVEIRGIGPPNSVKVKNTNLIGTAFFQITRTGVTIRNITFEADISAGSSYGIQLLDNSTQAVSVIIEDCYFYDLIGAVYSEQGLASGLQPFVIMRNCTIRTSIHNAGGILIWYKGSAPSTIDINAGVTCENVDFISTVDLTGTASTAFEIKNIPGNLTNCRIKGRVSNGVLINDGNLRMTGGFIETLEKGIEIKSGASATLSDITIAAGTTDLLCNTAQTGTILRNVTMNSKKITFGGVVTGNFINEEGRIVILGGTISGNVIRPSPSYLGYGAPTNRDTIIIRQNTSITNISTIDAELTTSSINAFSAIWNTSEENDCLYIGSPSRFYGWTWEIENPAQIETGMLLPENDKYIAEYFNINAAWSRFNLMVSPTNDTASTTADLAYSDQIYYYGKSTVHMPGDISDSRLTISGTPVTGFVSAESQTGWYVTNLSGTTTTTLENTLPSWKKESLFNHDRYWIRIRRTNASFIKLNTAPPPTLVNFTYIPKFKNLQLIYSNTLIDFQGQTKFFGKGIRYQRIYATAGAQHTSGRNAVQDSITGTDPSKVLFFGDNLPFNIFKSSVLDRPSLISETRSGFLYSFMMPPGMLTCGRFFVKVQYIMPANGNNEVAVIRTYAHFSQNVNHQPITTLDPNRTKAYLINVSGAPQNTGVLPNTVVPGPMAIERNEFNISLGLAPEGTIGSFTSAHTLSKLNPYKDANIFIHVVREVDTYNAALYITSVCIDVPMYNLGYNIY